MSVAHGRCTAVAVGLKRHDSREHRRCGMSVPIQGDNFIFTHIDVIDPRVSSKAMAN